MIDTIFWATGALVWAGNALFLAWLAGEVLWGAACAISYLRFVLEISRRRGKRATARQVIWWFLCKAWELAGHRNRGPNENHTWHSTTPPFERLGQWRGIGDYTIYVQKP